MLNGGPFENRIGSVLLDLTVPLARNQITPARSTLLLDGPRQEDQRYGERLSHPEEGEGIQLGDQGRLAQGPVIVCDGPDEPGIGDLGDANHQGDRERNIDRSLDIAHSQPRLDFLAARTATMPMLVIVAPMGAPFVWRL